MLTCSDVHCLFTLCKANPTCGGGIAEVVFIYEIRTRVCRRSSSSVGSSTVWFGTATPRALVRVPEAPLLSNSKFQLGRSQLRTERDRHPLRSSGVLNEVQMTLSNQLAAPGRRSVGIGTSCLSSKATVSEPSLVIHESSTKN